MAKLISNPNKVKLKGINWPRVEIGKFRSSDFSGGMVTNLNPINLQDNQFRSVRNFQVIYDSIIRRPGSALFTPAKPDSNAVLNFIAFNKNDGSVHLIRFTPSSIYSATSSAWTAITGAALAGTDDDRFQVAVVNDRLFFVNNGADVIQEIDVLGGTYAALGNAPEYRRITGFADRIIGANLAGLTANPAQIGWSGNLNFDEWDPLTDESAGSAILVASPSDMSDPIQGVYGFANVMVIARERSIWEATKKGIATDPFNFVARIPNIGSDCPFSIQQVPAGIAFVDMRTTDIYVYGLNSNLESIGTAIKETVFDLITDPTQVFSSYNQQAQQYSIAIPQVGNQLVPVFTFSFLTKSWWYEEYLNLTAINDLDFSSATIAIDDLVGDIDSLVGSIDDLSPTTAAVTRFYGQSDGELLYSSSVLDMDNGISYTSEIQSKLFELPTNDMYIAEIRFDYLPLKEGTFNVSYSVDGGYSFTAATSISFTTNDVGKRKVYIFKKQIKCTMFSFTVNITSGLIRFGTYELWTSQSGDTRQSTN